MTITIRRFAWDDLDALAATINRALAADVQGGPPDSVNLRYKLERYFDAERDIFVALREAAEMVGIVTARFWETPGKGLIHFDIVPEHRTPVLAARLVATAEDRLLAGWSAQLPLDAPIWTVAYYDSRDEYHCAAYEAAGYTTLAENHRFSAQIADLPAEPVLPPGVAIRMWHRDRDARALYALEALCHAEVAAMPFEDWSRAMHLDEPPFVTWMWPVAWAGDQIVGVARNFYNFHAESIEVGFIELLSVHPDWRGQGIGRALVWETVRRFRQHGAPRIATEASSPQWVAWLTRNGFQRAHTRVWVRKVLRRTQTGDSDEPPAVP